MSEVQEKQQVVEPVSGIAKYDRFLQKICNIDQYYVLNRADSNGYYGTAMIFAYMNGCKSTIKDFANHLKVSPVFLEEAFNNLRVNGIFGSTYDVANDKDLKGKGKSTKLMSALHRKEVAWCYLAGIAAGLTGLK